MITTGVNKLKNIDLAYLAGLIDGEGCIYFGKEWSKRAEKSSKRGFVWSPRLIIGMNDFGPVSFFANKLKTKVHILNQPDNKVRYTATIYSGNIRLFLPQITPYLQGKKEQAELLMKALSLLSHKSRSKSDDKLEIIYGRLFELHGSRKSIRKRERMNND